MARHILKMVWNRKSANALVILEIFISFLVVFAVVAMTTQLLSYYRRPLGFDYDNLWDVAISTSVAAVFGEAPEDMMATIERMRTELEAYDQVEGVAVSVYAPYGSSRSRMTWDEDEGFGTRTQYMRVSPSFLDVLGLELVAGRWFEPSDEHVHWTPVVISQELAEYTFGSEEAVGQVVVDNEEYEYRVLGVVSTFRRQGEFTPPVKVLFEAMWPSTPVRFPRRHLQIKLTAGTTAAFEETIMKTLRGVAPRWSYDLQAIEAKRESYLRERLAPIFAVSLVAVFLMVMVALGLMGVLWQNVTQRTRELGLRRAKGATKQNIYRQILSELLVVSGLGILLGMVVVAQVPILDFVPLDADIFASALGLSAVILLSLTAVCGLYPSWLATRIRPAEALHYE